MKKNNKNIRKCKEKEKLYDIIKKITSYKKQKNIINELYNQTLWEDDIQQPILKIKQTVEHRINKLEAEFIEMCKKYEIFENVEYEKLYDLCYPIFVCDLTNSFIPKNKQNTKQTEKKGVKTTK